MSFAIGRGRTLALVGESGCGKSTTGRAVLRLGPASAGRIRLCGRDILSLRGAELRQARRYGQMIFQDPQGSLDPRMTLLAQVAEPMRNFGIPRAEREDRVAELFRRVALPLALLRRYPHALSGGQRQRVAIARALALGPALIVADEAVSALDTTVKARVLDLLAELQDERALSYLFISHDISVVERVSHEVAVMYQGHIVERGPRAAVLGSPYHPYTKALLCAVPVADPARRGNAADPTFRPVAAPIHEVAHDPGPSEYDEVGPGHFVLTREKGF